LTNRAFNGGLAAFAAAATGFVVFAMPSHLFARIAGPLAGIGEAARFVAAGVSAGIILLAIWALLGAFDRKAARSSSTESETVVEAELLVPRLRRADAHPDAPAPRPLLAGKDLGEPAEENPAIELGEPQGHADTGQAGAVERDPLKRILMRTSSAPAVPEPLVTSPTLTKPLREPPAATEDPPETSSDEGASVADQPVAAVDERPGEEAGPKSLLDRLSQPHDENIGVARLLRRLDDDFGACEWPLPSGEGGESEPADEDRLRGVLDDLQRMAARNAG